MPAAIGGAGSWADVSAWAVWVGNEVGSHVSYTTKARDAAASARKTRFAVMKQGSSVDRPSS